MKSLVHGAIVCLCICFFSCTTNAPNQQVTHVQPVHQDTLYSQDFSIQYNLTEEATLKKVLCDRNGRISILSTAGLRTTHAGAFLYPGSLVPEVSYRPLQDRKITGLTLYEEQLVYLDDKALLSNAWAGKLYINHSLPGATLVAPGEDFSFLLSDGHTVQYLTQKQVLWQGNIPGPVIDIVFDKTRNTFWLLTEKSLVTFSVAKQTLDTVFEGEDFTCFTLATATHEIIVGSSNGFLRIDASSYQQKGEKQTKLPWTHITSVQEIDNLLWFGSEKGAFQLLPDGKYSYYASKRWLPSDKVIHIAKGHQGSVLILTDKGLGEIHFRDMTLHDKALYFEQQVRKRHIRNGFNATIAGMTPGNVSTGYLEDSDNDGLWTAMYLGSQVFRYAVTKSEDALQNCRESLDAMERLYTINPVAGFPSRSFERRGYALHDKARWRPADDPQWDWKSTTSSDEAIGHVFALSAMAELLEDQELRRKAITLLDTLMQHVVSHDFYLIDWDGKPTQWGKWHPDYVNARPKMVGDRKLNSSNIIAMLQTAYHFTRKEIYKEKAFELMHEHGYLDNLKRPIKEIGMAPESADELSKNLSEAWNHSDDEMYFLGYWGLYRYAFNDSLKMMYKEAILDHWEAERPEKEGAWNIFTAITGVSNFDLNEAVWYLQQYPLDMRTWQITNSQRKDIDLLAPNFRQQTTQEVLPPDELPINRHNANRFQLDGGDQGTAEYSAGDIWLLPYWMGRYLGVISAPKASESATENLKDKELLSDL
ncbi:hypothetical protein Q0590_21980 [Rhodocytophaga aerolata]|uniref:Uncharacterized protein n=1 Tax=Rhodocytophaga aerolata TaxID=455078 RepID=A0ABT8RCP9_9BACT|nr:hypothetical protein [Rhodocytophaga aerolata]MDO1448963.1 hypothetical protein [Rhodocytophaga aerolata]